MIKPEMLWHIDEPSVFEAAKLRELSSNWVKLQKVLHEFTREQIAQTLILEINGLQRLDILDRLVKAYNSRWRKQLKADVVTAVLQVQQND